MTKAAIFGGSFNPPHMAHVLCACYAKVVADLDEVWVLPSENHPYGKRLPPLHSRFLWCREAFRALDFVRIRMDERQNVSGYTYDLVRHLKRTYPHIEWYLIGGSDTANDMKNWHRGEELVKLVKVIEVPRGNDHPASLPALSSTKVRSYRKRGDHDGDIIKLRQSLPPGVFEKLEEEHRI